MKKASVINQFKYLNRSKPEFCIKIFTVEFPSEMPMTILLTSIPLFNFVLHQAILRKDQYCIPLICEKYFSVMI